LHRERINGGQVTLQVDHMAVAALRIPQPERLRHTVGARWQVGRRDDGVTACRAHRLGDGKVSGGHQHVADFRLNRPAPDMDNHGFTPDIGQRFAGKPPRGQPGGDDDDGILLFYHGVKAKRGKLRRVDL
jgi:hypothetical protein